MVLYASKYYFLAFHVYVLVETISSNEFNVLLQRVSLQLDYPHFQVDGQHVKEMLEIRNNATPIRSYSISFSPGNGFLDMVTL